MFAATGNVAAGDAQATARPTEPPGRRRRADG